MRPEVRVQIVFSIRARSGFHEKQSISLTRTNHLRRFATHKKLADFRVAVGSHDHEVDAVAVLIIVQEFDDLAR